VGKGGVSYRARFIIVIAGFFAGSALGMTLGSRHDAER